MSSYRLTQAAEDDVLGIYLHGLEMFGSSQANAYHDGLFEIFEFLASYPHSSRLRDEMPRPARIHPYRSHLVFYKVETDGSVLIVRIRHGREDWLAEG